MSVLPGLSTSFSSEPRSYTGLELRPHFLLSELGIRGSALAAFIGPCRVETQHLVDWEDRLAQDRIEAASMVHFLGEFFGADLAQGVLIQRLLMAQMGEILMRDLASSSCKLRREGDDLFVGDRKLSVSIVTASPVSQLLHVGVNIDPRGAPVPVIGLNELELQPEAFARAVLARFSEEWASMSWACVKVRPVL